MEHDDQKHESAGRGTATVHYNGGCPVCRPEVEHYKRSARHSGVQGVRFVDITTDRDGLTDRGISFHDAAKRFTVVDESGEVRQGVDGFIALWSRLPRYRWLARAVSVKPVKWLAEIVYDNVLAPLLYWSNRRAGRLDAP